MEEDHTQSIPGEQTEAAASVETGDLGTQSEPRQVPLDALQSERAERQRLQDEIKMMRENMDLMMAQQRQPQKQKDDFDGMTDEDVLTVGEFKKAIQQREKKYQMSLEELRMSQKYPDYQDTITKYLPEVLKTNPNLRNTLAQTNDYELAYYLARNSDAYKSSRKTTEKNADAERIVQNANRAGSLSSVGQNSPINQAKRYRDMSDEEFMQTVSRNMGYA